MPIEVTASDSPITVSASGTKIDAAVSGGQGPAGPAATITVGTVTTGAPGSSASVVNAGTTSAAVLNFTIPAGAAGATGPAGPQGPAGAAGASSWDDITGKPSTFALSAHAASHAVGGADALTPADIGAAAASDFDQGLKTFDYVDHAQVTSERFIATDGGTIILQGDGIYFGEGVQATPYTGKIGTTSGLVLKTGTDGVIEALAMGTAGQVLRVNSGAAGVEWVTLGGAASLNLGTTAGTVAAGDHTHAQLHDRSHAITSSSDHTATAWRLFYSNGSGVITELTLGSSGQALLSNGASAAPSWGSAGSNSASDLTVGTLAYARMADPTVTSPSQITASQNDYASFARGINRFTTNAARDLTGMVAGSDGEVRVLTNVGTTAANTLTIKDESSSSTAANRFYVPWNGDCVIPAEGSVVVFYDGTSSRWRVV